MENKTDFEKLSDAIGQLAKEKREKYNQENIHISEIEEMADLICANIKIEMDSESEIQLMPQDFIIVGIIKLLEDHKINIVK